MAASMDSSWNDSPRAVGGSGPGLDDIEVMLDLSLGLSPPPDSCWRLRRRPHTPSLSNQTQQMMVDIHLDVLCHLMVKE
jgi:hypothetical protein